MSNVTQFKDGRENAQRILHSGGGGGDNGGMDEKFAAIDKKFDAMAEKFDKTDAVVNLLRSDMAEIKAKFSYLATKEDVLRLQVDVSELKGKSETYAKANELSYIRGRVDRLPSTGTVLAILGIVGAFITLLPKAQALLGIPSP